MEERAAEPDRNDSDGSTDRNEFNSASVGMAQCRRSQMLVFALALTMVASLITATAIALHNEAEKSRAKVVARHHRIMR